MDDPKLEKKVTGSIKEAIGKVTGDRRLESEGKAGKDAADAATNAAVAATNKDEEAS